MDNFITYFKVLRLEGKSFGQAFTGSIGEIRKGFTGLQKTAITAVAGLVEFAVVKTVFRDLLRGTKKLGAGIAELVIAVAAAGAAMYVALGPIGLVIAGVVALTAAVVGASEAYSDMVSELVSTAVFDGQGSLLDILSTRLQLVADRYEAQHEKINELNTSIGESRKELSLMAQSVGALTATLGTSGEVTQEEIDTLKSEFDLLYQSIQTNMSNSASIITESLAGALARACPEVAESITILIGEYNRFVRETQGRAEEIKTTVDGIYDSMVGMAKGTEEYDTAIAKLNELYTELGYLEGGMSDAEWQREQTVEAFDITNVDWGSVEDATAKIDEIATAGSDALDALASARDASLKAVDEALAYASEYGTEEDVKMLGDVRAQIAADYASQESAIKSELENIFSDISDALVLEAASLAESAETEFGELGFFEKLFAGNEKGLAADKVAAFASSVFAPLEEALNTHAGELDLDTDAIGTSVASDVMNSVKNGFWALDPATAYGDYGLSALEGYAGGIRENLSLAEGAGTELADASLEGTRAALDSHSPSKAFAEIGKDSIDGYVQGIEQNWDVVPAVLKDNFASLADTFSSEVSFAVISESFGSTVQEVMGSSNNLKSTLSSAASILRVH